MRLAWTTDTVTPDVSRALHYTLLWGLEGVVLRTVGRAEERVPFVNEAPLRHRLESDQVPVCAIDPGLFQGDCTVRASWLNEIASFDDVAAFCRRFDVEMVLVGALGASGDSYDIAVAAKALRQLGEAAEKAGLTLGVRNEWGTAVATGAALATLLEHASHPAVQADWRPFDALHAGEDVLVGQAALQGRIACMTVWDAALDGEPAIPGDGQIDWDDLLVLLAADRWDGLVNLEVRGRPAGSFGLHAASRMISAVRRAKRLAKP